MKVEQVYAILNSWTKDVLGEVQYVDANGYSYNPDTKVPYVEGDPNVTPSYLVMKDLSNIVDIGQKIIAQTEISENAFSQVYAKLINHIGRVTFVDRIFKPLIPSIMKTNWEFGSVWEKIDADMPESEVNVKWELKDGQTYNQDMFTAPKNVRVKFFNGAVTFEIPMSFTSDQLKQSFSSATQLNSFFSMIATKINNKMTIDFANLTRATINSFIAATMYIDNSTRLNNGQYANPISGTHSINLLQLYKSEVPTANQELTAENCMKDAEFVRFCVLKFGLYSDRMQDISTLFNIGKKQRFTPKDRQHLVMLSEFKKSADVYLQSDTFHDEYTKLPNAESINYWQGSGNNYEFSNTGTIDVYSKVTADGETIQTLRTKVTGIIAIMFDEDALGINNERQQTTSHYNAKGDFVNNFYKAFGRYFNDYDENFILFYVA